MPDTATVFIRSKSVVSRVVAGETLIVPVRGKVGDLASIYSFNETASLIWKLLETPKSALELSSAVAREYDLDAERAAQDVDRFLSEMFITGLVEAGAVTSEQQSDSLTIKVSRVEPISIEAAKSKSLEIAAQSEGKIAVAAAGAD